MISIKIQNSNSDLVYDLCHCLSGCQAFVDNKIVITDPDERFNSYIYLGDQNDTTADVSFTVIGWELGEVVE